MRSYIRRIFDSKYGTITCYESTIAGYPAPHIIIRFDKSFSVFYHLSKKDMRRTWRLKDPNLKLRFQVAWRSLGGGWADVMGIVDTDSDSIGQKIQYSFKYVTKAVIGGKKPPSVTALNTLANNKAFNRGSVYISPAFVERTPNPVISRLDITRTKLQQAKNLLYTLKRKIKAKPDQETALSPKLSYLHRVISVLQSNLPPPEWVYSGTLLAYIVNRRKNIPAPAIEGFNEAQPVYDRGAS
jgi:hypothetical protein